MKRHSLQPGVFTWLVVLAVLVAAAAAPGAFAQAGSPEVPKAKQTSLGLYLTAAEAYEKWRADPEHIKVLDVRTTEEYLFVGHAPMAWNVPLMSQTYQWNADKQNFAMQPNPDFVSQVMEFSGPTDTLLVMCRSGGRSAMAVNTLAEAGFTNVYQIVDGMEGDVITDPESVFKGQHLRNGWKNSGNPWTYQPEPRQMRFISKETVE
jgi:rhodanese-related sulfurtransferase